MANLRKLVGTRIREIRRKRGLTQAKLAEKVNVETTTINKLENGSHFPKEENIEAIANVLDVDIEELFKFGHFEEKRALINKIERILQNLDEDNVKTIYKIIKGLTS